ncbi:Predicted dehydrogenase [Virgibacillus subterraneus]|uniref:Predicted dehydrogenase n=1 Tax=Virgibacillus subterraneus TaxID=621109 RepID=A0A1H9AKC0_9BACI|nr:Gfo/Idh/MocA family oxidoreductase [Virgibacillus subterraneus]SEP76931.1 Predicted dehydrogenase [Virgibacillus subterraneus]
MTSIKFGIIGAGVLAPLHAKAIVSNPQAELVAISDIDEQKAAVLAEEFGVAKTFTNYHEMLQEQIDVVCLCVPSGMHAKFALACAAKGKHILCEKPLDISFQQMDQMIHACNQVDVKLGAVFQRRTLPHFIAARDAKENGLLGNMMMIHAYLKYFRDDDYYASAGWRGKWELDGGGALMNQGVHGIDLLQWIGGEIESVFAYNDTLARTNIEVEDTAVAVVKFKHGGFGTIQGATSVFPEQQTSIEVNGDKGTVKVSDTTVDIWEFMNNDRELEEPQLPQDDHDGHSIIVGDMIEAILENREPMISGIEARKSVEIILAIYESARSGREVVLSDFHPFKT